MHQNDKPLLERELLFCYNYVKYNFNGKKAVEATDGYNTTTAGSAYVQAHQLLKLPKIKDKIRENIDEMLGEIKSNIYKDIVEKCICIITADINDYVSPDGSPKFTEWEEVDPRPVKSIVKTPTAQGDKWQLELHDPKPYIDIMTRLMDIAKPETIDLNINVSSADDLKNLSNEQLEKIINANKKVVEK